MPEEAVETEINRLREGFARLNPVDRAAKEGDVVLIDYEGKIDGEPFEGGTASDYLLELGEGRVLPELEQASRALSAGDERQLTVPFPDDYPRRRGRRQDCRVRRQGQGGPREGAARPQRRLRLRGLGVRHPRELRETSPEDPQILDRQIAERFREAASTRWSPSRRSRLPDPVVQARAEEMWRRVERQLSRQGMDPENYLQIQGKTREEMIEQARPDAEQALKREAVLEAVAEAEGIEITEEDELEALQIPPGHEDHGHPEPAGCPQGDPRVGARGALQGGPADAPAPSS